MVKDVKSQLKEILTEMCEWLDIDILEGAIDSDYVHMYMSVPPKHSPSHVMKILNIKSRKFEGYILNHEAVGYEEKLDGISVLLTNRYDLEPAKVVESYKNLKEVEMLFDDLKSFVDIRPIRHGLERRVRAHVFICILSLIAEKNFEINYMGGKAVMEPLEEISKSKLIKYKVRFSERDDSKGR